MRFLSFLAVFALAAKVSSEKTVTVEIEAEATSTADSDDAKTTATSTPVEVLIVTVAVEALTTTFTPPSTCLEQRLTQLSSGNYQIWLNEPQPVPNSKITNCYPSQFMKHYTSIDDSGSSMAPLMSPLVCPMGWHTAQQYPNGYIACCPSSYNLAPPTKTSNSDRPAYGGTCYSGFSSGQRTTVTAYNESVVTATAAWVASTSLDQAYGHVIEGFALDLLSSSTAETTAAASSTSIGDNDDEDSGLSGGAIAGIVIGALAGVALLLVAAFLLYRRRSRKNHQQIEELGGNPVHHEPPPSSIHSSPAYAFADMKPNHSHSQTTSPVGVPNTPAYRSVDETSTVVEPHSNNIASPIAVAGQHNGPHEVGDMEYAELDSGWKGHEMSGR